MKAYIRVPKGVGTKPYTYIFKNINGSVIETRTSFKEEEVFDTSVPAFAYEVKDANNQLATQSIDGVTVKIQNKYWKIYSSTYGGVDELCRHITKLKTLGGGAFNIAGVPFTTYDFFKTQQQWDNPVWNQKFDHTVYRGTDPDVNSFAHPYDKVIYTAYHSGNSFETRTGLKIGVNFGRMGENGQPTLKDQGYAFTYPNADIQRRPDGRLHNEFMNYGLPYTTSFASDEGLTYSKELLYKFCNRYSMAINDGTIHGINFFLDESGEAQYPFHYINADGSDAGRGLGDFSDVMRRKFMEFCKANFTTPTDQTTNRFNNKYGTNYNAFTIDNFNRDQLAYAAPAELRKLFFWFQMEKLSEFEITMQEYVYSKVNITRSKLWILDVGSIFDGLLAYRKTLNINRRLSQSNRWIAVKGNNDVYDMKWVEDQLYSAAKFCGAIPINEPSPTLDRFTVPTLTEAVNYIKDKGIHLSAFIPQVPEGSDAFWTQVSNNTGLPNVNTSVKRDDLDSNGIPITATVRFKDVVFDEFTDFDPLKRIREAYTAKANANPNKGINIFVDDSDILADLSLTPTVNRVPKRTAIIGNSFTLHPVALNLNWYWGDRGMAATSPDADYVHQLRYKIQQVDPTATATITSNGALFEGFYHDSTQWKWENLKADLQAGNFDLIVLRIGENINDNLVYDRNFKAALKKFISVAREVNPSIVFSVSTSTWNNPNSDAIVRQVVQEENTANSPVVLIDLDFISTTFKTNKFASPYFAFNQQFNYEFGQAEITDEGVLQHAGDYGMKEIANKIWTSVILPLYSNNS